MKYSWKDTDWLASSYLSSALLIVTQKHENRNESKFTQAFGNIFLCQLREEGRGREQKGKVIQGLVGE